MADVKLVINCGCGEKFEATYTAVHNKDTKPATFAIGEALAHSHNHGHTLSFDGEVKKNANGVKPAVTRVAVEKMWS
jgi:hypothetical protein